MTELFIQVKQVGKKKFVIERQAIELPGSVASLRDLLSLLVRQGVAAFNEKTEEGNWTKYLTDFDLETSAESGKVGFDARYNGRQQDADQAVETACLAFEDGLFRVFFDDEEIESLDAMQTFDEGGVLTFIRLTMLSGRNW